MTDHTDTESSSTVSTTTRPEVRNVSEVSLSTTAQTADSLDDSAPTVYDIE
ncbi:MAG: hypothetical protein H0U01_10135, partial [Acidimicrobiia bacterium]|nr:hypothetical protein [Acidimicrobiia bacterium]